MHDLAETSEEVLWAAGLAVVTAVLLFALLAGITWAATMLGSWAGTFEPPVSRRRQPEVSPTGQLTPVPPMPQ